MKIFVQLTYANKKIKKNKILFGIEELPHFSEKLTCDLAPNLLHSFFCWKINDFLGENPGNKNQN
jgi:hypothetical protein